jgi:hypothetical protein
MQSEAQLANLAKGKATQFTPERAAEAGKKGGIAYGKAAKRRRDLKAVVLKLERSGFKLPDKTGKIHKMTFEEYLATIAFDKNANAKVRMAEFFGKVDGSLTENVNLSGNVIVNIGEDGKKCL